MDTFPELERLVEVIGFHLERFDFEAHNDDGNVDVVNRAKAALDDLQGAISDLVP